ncbi:thymidylate synthase [Patescibacteria group bacterium]
MRQYLSLLKHVLDYGEVKTDPQGVGNISICGYQMRFNLADGFPFITTRDMSMSVKAMVYELLWFLSGSTNIKDLNKHGVHLWDQWATPEICASLGLEPGDLGPIYGKQWRSFSCGDGVEVDQIQNMVDLLKSNPDSRRALVSSWNPADMNKVFVACCHGIFHFCHANGKLTLHLFQRSADIPVGVPFNIASYSLLLMMMAQVTGLKAYEFVHTISDGHIYLDQRDAVEEQIEREPRELPKMVINPNVTDIFSFQFEDFELSGYNPHPKMKIPVAL